MPKIKGSLCNIPVNEIYDNCKSLPRPVDSNGLSAVKLKRKAEYRSHVLFKPVRPLFNESFLKFLKHYNHLYAYSYIQKNMENILSNVLDFNNNELNNNGASSNESSSSSIVVAVVVVVVVVAYFQNCLSVTMNPLNVTLETAEEQDVLDGPLAKFKTVSDGTTVISKAPSSTHIEEAFIVIPGEGKNLGHFLEINFVKNLHIHIVRNQSFSLIVIIYFWLIQFYRNCSLIVR